MSIEELLTGRGLTWFNKLGLSKAEVAAVVARIGNDYCHYNNMAYNCGAVEIEAESCRGLPNLIACLINRVRDVEREGKSVLFFASFNQEQDEWRAMFKRAGFTSTRSVVNPNSGNRIWGAMRTFPSSYVKKAAPDPVDNNWPVW